MLSPYNHYRVHYVWTDKNQRLIRDCDTILASSATEAAQNIRRWCGHLTSFRIERVYVDTGFSWEEREWFEEEL